MILRRALREGLLAGVAGVSVMTVGEKLEQRITGRPDSDVPARVLERLAGLSESKGGRLRAVNLAMHLGQGVLAGTVRSLMANAGMRGPVASAMFTVVRLSNTRSWRTPLASVRRRRHGHGQSLRWTCSTRWSMPSPPVWLPTRWPDGTVLVRASDTP